MHTYGSSVDEGSARSATMHAASLLKPLAWSGIDLTVMEAPGGCLPGPRSEPPALNASLRSPFIFGPMKTGLQAEDGVA